MTYAVTRWDEGLSVKAYAKSLDNDYEPFLTRAQAAFDDGRPAFWLTSKYHDQAGWSFLHYANEGKGLHAAEVAYEREFQRAFDIPEALLDRLVPLNTAAVADLQNAYELAGTFRTTKELAKRCPSIHEDRIEPVEMREAS